MFAFVRTLSLRTLVVSLSALALACFFAPPPIVHANPPERNNNIVRNDGRSFVVPDSLLTFSPSHAVTINAAQLKKQTVSHELLQLFQPMPGGKTGMDEPQPTSIIGADERVRVTDTTVFPYSAIVELVVNFNFVSAQCSGWMIGPAKVATAAHCLYYPSFGGWAKSITVYPGRDGTVAPFGSAVGKNWYVQQKWLNTQATGVDYGIIQLETRIGDTVGYFGYRFFTNDNYLKGHAATVSGYPGDKVNAEADTQWMMDGPIDRVNKRRLFYAMDTYAGQSGSPLFGIGRRQCNPCGFGIHTYGVGGGWTENSATRITKRAFNFFQAAGVP